MVFIVLFIFSGFDARGAELVAFHGLNQSMRSDAKPNPRDCTAPLVNFENHRFIENTLTSLEVAFDLGADMGHFNIRRTADRQLVAFHDDDLSCRTDGVGSLRQSRLDQLKVLDVGYGYSPYGCTSDNAKKCCGTKSESECFPTRTFGRGLMPTLSEILERFPDRSFAINDKDSDVKTGDLETIDLLEAALRKYDQSRIGKLIYIGGAPDLARKKIRGLRVVSSEGETIHCFQAPNDLACKSKLFALPLAYVATLQPKLAEILAGLHRSGSQVMVFNVNSESDVDSIREFSFDMIGTYRIDRTVNLLRSKVFAAL